MWSALNRLADWFRDDRIGRVVKGAIRAGIIAIILLNLPIPLNLDMAKSEAMLGWAAFVGAVFAYAQHELVPWIMGKTS